MTIKTYRRLIVALIMIIALGLSHSSPKAATAVSDYTFTNVTNAAGVGNDIVGRSGSGNLNRGISGIAA